MKGQNEFNGDERAMFRNRIITKHYKIGVEKCGEKCKLKGIYI